MDANPYPVMKGDREMALRREIKRRLRVVEQKEQEQANVSQGKRKIEIKDEENVGPLPKKARVFRYANEPILIDQGHARISNNEQQCRTTVQCHARQLDLCSSCYNSVRCSIHHNPDNYWLPLRHGTDSTSDSRYQQPSIGHPTLRSFSSSSASCQSACPSTSSHSHTCYPTTIQPSRTSLATIWLPMAPS